MNENERKCIFLHMYLNAGAVTTRDRVPWSDVQHLSDKEGVIMRQSQLSEDLSHMPKHNIIAHTLPSELVVGFIAPALCPLPPDPREHIHLLVNEQLLSHWHSTDSRKVTTQETPSSTVANPNMYWWRRAVRALSLKSWIRHRFTDYIDIKGWNVSLRIQSIPCRGRDME